MKVVKPGVGSKQVGFFKTDLRVGDRVMVLAGGNEKKKGKFAGVVGQVVKFLPKSERVIVSGVNYIKRHKRASQMGETSGIITKEGSIHISNVQWYSDEHKRPFRLKAKKLEDGRKVRGFINPKTKQFESIDA